MDLRDTVFDKVKGNCMPVPKQIAVKRVYRFPFLIGIGKLYVVSQFEIYGFRGRVRRRYAFELGNSCNYIRVVDIPGTGCKRVGVNISVVITVCDNPFINSGNPVLVKGAENRGQGEGGRGQ